MKKVTSTFLSTFAFFTLLLTGCSDASTPPETVAIESNGAVKQGATLTAQAEALGVLSVAIEQRDTLLKSYRACRAGKGPSGFDCETFVYQLHSAAAQVDDAILDRLRKLITEIRLLESVPADRIEKEIVVFGGPVSVKQPGGGSE